MQAVTLELVTPVPPGAHWLIRKQVHNLASQIASQHFYHRLRWAVDGRRLTAPLLKKQLGCTLHSGKHVQTGLNKQKGCEPLISCAREVHTHTRRDRQTQTQPTQPHPPTQPVLTLSLALNLPKHLWLFSPAATVSMARPHATSKLIGVTFRFAALVLLGTCPVH